MRDKLQFTCGSDTMMSDENAAPEDNAEFETPVEEVVDPAEALRALARA